MMAFGLREITKCGGKRKGVGGNRFWFYLLCAFGSKLYCRLLAWSWQYFQDHLSIRHLWSGTLLEIILCVFIQRTVCIRRVGLHKFIRLIVLSLVKRTTRWWRIKHNLRENYDVLSSFCTWFQYLCHLTDIFLGPYLSHVCFCTTTFPKIY